MKKLTKMCLMTVISATAFYSNISVSAVPVSENGKVRSYTAEEISEAVSSFKTSGDDFLIKSLQLQLASLKYEFELIEAKNRELSAKLDVMKGCLSDSTYDPGFLASYLLPDNAKVYTGECKGVLIHYKTSVCWFFCYLKYYLDLVFILSIKCILKKYWGIG